MNKKTLLVTVLVLVSAISLFAAGTGEADAVWSNANAKIDQGEKYIAGYRELTDTLGRSASVSTTSTYEGKFLQRNVNGNSDLYNFVSNLYDGAVITPFSNGVSNLSYSYSGIEGSNIVYDVNYAFDKSYIALAKEYSSDNILGYDSDDGDFDGAIKAKVYIDSQSGNVVKIVNYFSFNGYSFEQVINYKTAVIDGVEGSFVDQMSINGSYTSTKNGVTTTTNYTISEILGNYFRNTYFARGN